MSAIYGDFTEMQYWYWDRKQKDRKQKDRKIVSQRLLIELRRHPDNLLIRSKKGDGEVGGGGRYHQGIFDLWYEEICRPKMTVDVLYSSLDDLVIIRM